MYNTFLAVQSVTIIGVKLEVFIVYVIRLLVCIYMSKVAFNPIKCQDCLASLGYQAI